MKLIKQLNEANPNKKLVTKFVAHANEIGLKEGMIVTADEAEVYLSIKGMEVTFEYEAGPNENVRIRYQIGGKRDNSTMTYEQFMALDKFKIKHIEENLKKLSKNIQQAEKILSNAFHVADSYVMDGVK